MSGKVLDADAAVQATREMAYEAPVEALLLDWMAAGLLEAVREQGQLGYRLTPAGRARVEALVRLLDIARGGPS
jgi:hypothetical protein